MTEPSIESAFRRTHRGLAPRFLKQGVDFAECPVESSLGLLGKKWTIVILRDIGMYEQDRFHLLLRSLAGIPQKVLSARLKELERGGFLRHSVERSTPPKVVRWSLTDRGYDAFRIGMVIAVYGARWHADRVFDDGRARTPLELYDREGMELLLRGLVGSEVDRDRAPILSEAQIQSVRRLKQLTGNRAASGAAPRSPAVGHR
ncbi:MAG TPA: helix-turn-helix domain-containing protein [Thermoplasmata archaeon]|nr:helix-turn-helix domain-containing protein [Thermoplasmata archaeon]